MGSSSIHNHNHIHIVVLAKGKNPLEVLVSEPQDLALTAGSTRPRLTVVHGSEDGR